MNKQEIQEALDEVKEAFHSFERSDEVANLLNGAFRLDLDGELNAALFDFVVIFNKVQEAIDAPEFNTSAAVPTNLAWFNDAGFEVAEVIVPDVVVGGKWNIIVNEIPKRQGFEDFGFEVFLEAEAGWSCSFFGFATEADAKAAAQAAIEAVAAGLTENDGPEFVSEVFRGSLVNSLDAQKAGV